MWRHWCKVFRSTYVLLTGDVLFDSCVQLLPLVTTVHSVLCRSISCTCPYNTCLWHTQMIAKYLSTSKPNIQEESVGHGESQVHAYRYVPLVTCSRLLVKAVDNLTARCGVTMTILWHTNKKTSLINPNMGTVISVFPNCLGVPCNNHSTTVACLAPYWVRSTN